MHRALNQKTARDLPFAAFLDLAADLGCVGVEPRNDLGRPFFDGLPPAEAAALAKARGLRLLGLSEVYGFNVWDDTRAAEIAALIDVAEAAGAETISLIPTVDDRPTLALRAALREVLALAEGRKVLPLIEPIGFASSSLRGKAALVEAIEATGGPTRVKLVHDTFQHCIAGETEIFAPYTGIVHISGISNPSVTLDAAQDAHRITVEPDDRCGTLEQIRGFLDAGYQGAFSFECTEIGLITSESVGESLRQSFEGLDAAL